jgi:TPR repeat protein
MDRPLVIGFVGTVLVALVLGVGAVTEPLVSPEQTYAQGRAFEAMGYPKEAGHWFLKAAHQGHPVAQVEVGFMYAYGRADLLRDPYEAERWFSRALRAEPTMVLATFGEPSTYGQNGVLRDERQAAYWFGQAVRSCRVAARQGNLDAQTLLGGLYGNGMGVERDQAEALQLWRDAARRGHAPAQYWLARAYEHAGEHDRAFPWMRRAALQGWPAAQYHLSMMYQGGDGTAQDLDEALIWLRRSAAQGYLFAERQLQGMQAAGAF